MANIGEPMRKHRVIPLDHLIPASKEPNPSSWGEVIEHQYGWRSEYAAVRSIIKITGNIDFWSKQRSLLDLGKKYGCALV